MSRYNGSNGSNGGNDYEDDTTLKLKRYSTVRLTPTGTTGNSHQRYGQSFIANFEDAEILDGIVLQREDKPGTWNVYSADKFFNLNPEDGLVYENFDEEEGYSGEMSAQDILDHPRVAGHSTSGGNDDYYFEPVGVVIEEAGDIAIHENADVETTDEPAIKVGDASMLLSNSSWVRTFAKKMTEQGESMINDNGEDPTPRGEDDDNPKYSSHDWMTTEEPTLREELEGRSLELWVTEETNTWEDGESTTYTAPNVMDVKTGNFVSIDNALGDDSTESDTDKAAATDGGTTTADSSDTSTTESPDEPSADSDNSGNPDGVPESLDSLLNYLARNADEGEEITADDVESFAGDDVDDPEEIDWEAAAAEAESRR